MKKDHERTIITITVMIVAIIEVLDSTIVNVALPDMMGALSASTDEITWVLTAYIVASAIVMPLTGFLTNRFGRKPLLIGSIIGFMVASFLCGFASSLNSIVFFRVLQGVFGASLVPLAQVILRDTYPKEAHGKAMAIWGMGIMVAPVLGPTLGGYITNALNWRWVFFVNIPVCLFAIFLAIKFVKNNTPRYQPIDWFGVVLLIAGIGGLQLFLDRGNAEDWFASLSILITFIVWTIALSFFVIRSYYHQNPIVNVRLFKDGLFRNSMLLLLAYCTALFGSIALQPIMLEQLMHFPTLDTGIIMAPRGIASAVGMSMVAMMMNRVDVRWLVTFGLMISAVGTYLMTLWAPTTPETILMIDGAIQGFGMGFIFVPLATVSFSHLPKSEEANASGLFSLTRMIGSSMGISLFSTFLSQMGQINWQGLSSKLSVFNPNLSRWLDKTGTTLTDPLPFYHWGKVINSQSHFMAFIDSFIVSAAAFLLLLPLVYFLKHTVKK